MLPVGVLRMMPSALMRVRRLSLAYRSRLEIYELGPRSMTSSLRTSCVSPSIFAYCESVTSGGRVVLLVAVARLVVDVDVDAATEFVDVEAAER